LLLAPPSVWHHAESETIGLPARAPTTRERSALGREADLEAFSTIRQAKSLASVRTRADDAMSSEKA